MNNMKQKLLCLILYIIMSPSYYATVSAGENTIIDLETNKPIPNAKIFLPRENYSTYTNEDGSFVLDARIDGQTIMSVEKDGYRPYSMTIDKSTAAKPMVMSIEKSKVEDIVLNSEILHLGDDNFSANSANSGEFKVKSIGPFYTKTFKMTADALTRMNYLVIGSIIGVDTKMARSMGQNKVVHSYASPAEIFFNGNKISEIQLNGDGQRIKLPNNLIRPDNINEITIKAGKNLMQTAYIDYDDIEIMNMSIQTE